MNPSMSRQGRQRVFAWVVLGCLALAVGYPAWIIWRAKTGSSHTQTQGTPEPMALPEELEAIQTEPHLIFLRQAGPHYGLVTLATIEPALQTAQTALACDRIHYAAGNGICLIYDTSSPAEDLLAPIQAWATLFGPDFKPRYQLPIEGIPSRARVSPDGNYAAYTVFVNGHSYADANMSTATVLLDTARGASLGNLEEFDVWKDGQRYRAPDFNFWGVTFAQDSNRFYATLRSYDTTFLVQGDVTARTLTVLRENVECPSLSPDGTRIAFKKLTSRGMWQLTVLDLTTMEETPSAEKESIDDQVEWLDAGHILYQKADPDHPTWISVFVVPADGSGQPEVFLAESASPVVVRH